MNEHPLGAAAFAPAGVTPKTMVPTGDIEWRYPRDGYGVLFSFG